MVRAARATGTMLLHFRSFPRTELVPSAEPFCEGIIEESLDTTEDDAEIPDEFLCPITGGRMVSSCRLGEDVVMVQSRAVFFYMLPVASFDPRFNDIITASSLHSFRVWFSQDLRRLVCTLVSEVQTLGLLIQLATFTSTPHSQQLRDHTDLCTVCTSWVLLRLFTFQYGVSAQVSPVLCTCSLQCGTCYDRDSITLWLSQQTERQRKYVHLLGS